MSIGTTAAIVAGVGAAATIGGSVIAADASKTAAGQQVSAEQAALDFQKQVFQTQQQNFAPYLQAGTSSLATLMQSLGVGAPPGTVPQFGPGSLPPAPQFTQAPFVAPTLDQAKQAPGYQFTLDEGLRSVAQASAAAGGAVSGGTFRAADEFANNLAETNYNDVFSRALAQYNTGIDAYKAQLAGYGATLAGQSQQFQQLLTPVELGAGATQNLSQAGTNAASSIGTILGNIGASTAAGTVGSANALSGGLTNAGNLGIQSILLNNILGKGSGFNAAPIVNSSMGNYDPLSAIPQVP